MIKKKKDAIHAVMLDADPKKAESGNYKKINLTNKQKKQVA